MSTPLINRPEVAIVGVNRIVERPVISEGEIMAAKLMNLSTSCDHRVVDGWDAANFIQAVKRLLETPVLLFATRSEERRVGKECVSTCRSRGSRSNEKNKIKRQMIRQIQKK